MKNLIAAILLGLPSLVSANEQIRGQDFPNALLTIPSSFTAGGTITAPNFSGNGSGLTGVIAAVSISSLPGTGTGITISTSLTVSGAASTMTIQGQNASGFSLKVSSGIDASAGCITLQGGQVCGPVSGGSSPTGSAGGDLGGTYPNPTVVHTQPGAVDFSTITSALNTKLSSGAVASGDISGNYPGPILVVHTQSGSVDFSTITAAIAANSGGGPWTTLGAVVSLTTATNNVVVQTTLTVQGGAFSVGGSSFVVTAGSATVAYYLSASSIAATGRALTGYSIVSSSGIQLNGGGLLDLGGASGIRFPDGKISTTGFSGAGGGGGGGAATNSTNTWTASQIFTGSSITVGAYTAYFSTISPNVGLLVNGWSIVASTRVTRSPDMHVSNLQVGKIYRLMAQWQSHADGQQYTLVPSAASSGNYFTTSCDKTGTLNTTHGTASATISLDSSGDRDLGLPNHTVILIIKNTSQGMVIDGTSSYFTGATDLEVCRIGSVTAGSAATSVLSIHGNNPAGVTGTLYLEQFGTPNE